MAMGKRNSEWLDKIKEWQASGQGAAVWCRTQNIPLTTFYGWKKRWRSKSAETFNQPLFIELKDKSKKSNFIILEIHEVKIHLTDDFDASLLKRCLAALRGAGC